MKKFGLLRHDQIIETRVQLSLYLLVLYQEDAGHHVIFVVGKNVVKHVTTQ